MNTNPNIESLTLSTHGYAIAFKSRARISVR